MRTARGNLWFVDPVIYESHPDLDRPVMITAFRGWNDAGESATSATTFLRERWGGELFARVDPEEFFDFQVSRPEVKLVDGVSRVIEWPACEFAHARAGGRDVVIFTGFEPNIRWRTFATAILDVGRAIGAERLITLGAFLADVPHTRPVPVVGSAGTPEEAERLGLQTSTYEGPTGIVGVLHDLSNRSQIPSVSFWAAAPHYIPSGANPKAAVALVHRVSAFLDVAVDTAELLPVVESWEQRVSELVGENDALTEYVRRLEETAGEEITPGNVPSGEAIAAEVERFLRDQRGEH
jgi:proteasome assembly chaperone (PAC2) family protein